MIVAFIGHRQIKKTEELKERLTKVLTGLIEKEGADVFLFGSKSKFDDLCLDAVTKLKQRYPHVKRVYVRAMYEEVSERYVKYLLTLYDETFFPESVTGAGYRSYVKRNQVMVEMCDLFIAYYDKNYQPTDRLRISRKSGTMLAINYALKRNKRIINLFEQ